MALLHTKYVCDIIINYSKEVYKKCLSRDTLHNIKWLENMLALIFELARYLPIKYL